MLAQRNGGECRIKTGGEGHGSMESGPILGGGFLDVMMAQLQGSAELLEGATFLVEDSTYCVEERAGGFESFLLGGQNINGVTMLGKEL
jgi:hypothetical protein